MRGQFIFVPDEQDAPSVGSAELFAGAPDVMSAAQAAELLGVCISTIRREIARGALEVVHVGRAVRITKTALLRYLGEVSA